MSPAVRRTMAYFHLLVAVRRLREHAPLERTVVELLEALMPLWEDSESCRSLPPPYEG